MIMAVCKHWGHISTDEMDKVIDWSMSILSYSVCKSEQKDAARNVLEGKDVFVSVPTASQRYSKCSPLVLKSYCRRSKDAISDVLPC